MPETRPRPEWTESERLAALQSYAILDTAPERAFDDIVQLTAQLLDAPIVAINLIDAGRQWFKSEMGLGVREMPLDDSICKVALLESERMVVSRNLEVRRSLTSSGAANVTPDAALKRAGTQTAPPRSTPLVRGNAVNSPSPSL